MNEITEDAFEEQYRPLPTPDGDTVWTFEQAKTQPVEHVWTIVDDGQGDLYAEGGFHVVNRVGYVVTEVPWPSEASTAEWFVVGESTLDPNRHALIEVVKAHALDHYEDGGWDVVVECWEDHEIAEHIQDATSPQEAIAAFETVVSVWADRQADARNSAF